MDAKVRLLTRTDVERLLDMRTCIAAVEDAFRRHADAPSGVLGVHAGKGGFHVKAAILDLTRPYFVAKVNANFPGNPSERSLPTIQGVLVLFDASNGMPLAIMDSMAITTLRTAAASAVAASFLARRDADLALFIGCGVQARAHMAAMAFVRPLRRALVYDIDVRKAQRFTEEMRDIHEFDVIVARDLAEASRASAIIVTCTPSTRAYLGVSHVLPGTFVAAVGADNHDKQEIETGLLKRSAIVVDDLDQCASIGDLHHAIDLGVLVRRDVRATLGEVVTGVKRGRTDDDEIIVFDSTGVAIEDVAAAAVTYERAVEAHVGLEVKLAS